MKRTRKTIGINSQLLEAIGVEAKRDKVNASRWMQRVCVAELQRRGRPFKGALRTPGRPKNGGRLTRKERTRLVDTFMRGVA